MSTSPADIDFEDFLLNLIREEPKPPRSIQLDFDTVMDLKSLFEMLLSSFTWICKAFHGNQNGQVNVATLRDTDILKIKQYLSSFGYQLHIDTYNYNMLNIFEINALQTGKYCNITITSQTQLKDLYFIIKCDEIVYKIWFDTNIL